MADLGSRDQSFAENTGVTRRAFLGRTTALVASTVIGVSYSERALAALPATAGKAPVSVLVNQVGYDAVREKIFLVQVEESLPQQPALVFQLITETGRVVFAGGLVSRGRVNGGTPSDWGVRYWTGDFSQFQAVGTYRVRIQVGSEKYLSFPFHIGGEVIFAETMMPAVHFFGFQRCGYAVRGLHPACHMDDARIPAALGGGHLDATGGWHDAGDFNKYTSLASPSVYALLASARGGSKQSLSDASRQEILNEGLWGADWLRKMWQPGKGIVYQDVWSGYDYFRGTPDKETDNRPGTADDRPVRGEGPNAMTAAALAAAARTTGRREYRDAAEDLWRGAVKSSSNYPEDAWVATCNGIPDLGEDTAGRMVRRTASLLLADLELEALTGEHQYTEDARSCVEFLVHEQKPDGLWPSDFYSHIVFDGVPPAALALYVQAHPGTGLATHVEKALQLWLHKKLALAANPFSLIQWSESAIFNPYVGKTWYVGQNSQYLSEAWALYLVAGLLKDPRAGRLADHQLDWILGLNPYNLCLMEGQGTSNPPQYFPGWTPDRKCNTVPGAIPNGFCRPNAREDRPWFDMRNPPEQVDWHTSEPWEPHNAFFILALAARVSKGIPV